MGLALCHTLPRDPLHRVAALFAALAALLQFIALVDAANNHRMAWLTVSLPSGTWKVTPYNIVRPNNQGTACSRETDYWGPCRDFVNQGRIVVGVTATSCALTVVLAVVVMCCVVRRTPKNTALLGLYVLCLLLPFIFAVAACGVMGDGYWSKTKNALPGGSVTYSDGGALCIAACVLYGLGLTMSLIKAATFLVEHRALKDQVRQEAAARAGSSDPTAVAVVVPDHDLKVDERLALRIVNDDWERQKSIWLERRRAVVDILRQSELTSKDARGSFAKSGSLQRSSTGPSTAPAVPVAFPLEPITDEKVQHLHEAHHQQGGATTNGTGTSDTA